MKTAVFALGQHGHGALAPAWPAGAMRIANIKQARG
jgi:hypothetical protein